MHNELIELAHIRNRLACNIFQKNDEELLEVTKQRIIGLNTPFNELALRAIKNCEDDIKKGNFKSAVQEIQLIHNFPFNNPKNWNFGYFYKMELLSYIEMADDVERTKTLISLLAKLQKEYDIYCKTN